MKAETALLVAIVFLYVLMALVLSLGCSMHIGDAPCFAYGRALEVRLTECELLPDDWYREQLRKVYAQCDGGPLGITLIDSDEADACIAKVHATSCLQLQHGGPSCIGMVQL